MLLMRRKMFLLKQQLKRNPSLVYSKKNGALSELLLMFIHFSQTNGLRRSDGFYTEPNNPKACTARAVEFHCAYVNTIKSAQMPTWFNSFFSAVDDNWIQFPQSGCPFPVCVWRGAVEFFIFLRGVRVHTPFTIYLTPITFGAKCGTFVHKYKNTNQRFKAVFRNDTQLVFMFASLRWIGMSTGFEMHNGISCVSQH